MRHALDPRLGSLPYLQCCVKDIGLREPFNRLIPLVEVAFTTPINRVPASQTIGTIQPGVIWAGQYQTRRNSRMFLFCTTP